MRGVVQSRRPGGYSMLRLLSGAAQVACVVGLLGLFPSTAIAQGWTPTGGGDHAGADWTPADGDVIAGLHTNIGVFTVPGGATVRVAPWDGAQFGSVEVRAEVVLIAGTLNGNGSGYGGG